MSLPCLFYIRVSAYDEGDNFPFSFNEVGLCVGRTHMAKTLGEPLETEALSSKPQESEFY